MKKHYDTVRKGGFVFPAALIVSAFFDERRLLWQKENLNIGAQKMDFCR
nr:MAG TPA: Sodium/potassium-transporting ATPase subunit alpha-1 [Caudoviricetes sp.]